MKNKILDSLGWLNFLFLGYFAIAGIYKYPLAILYFNLFSVLPSCVYILNSKKTIRRVLFIAFGNTVITLAVGGKGYWDFLQDNILPLIFSLLLILVLTLIASVIDGYRNLQKNRQILLERINELNFSYQPRISLIQGLIKLTLPFLPKNNVIIADLIKAISDFIKIEDTNNLVECIDILERRYNKLIEIIHNTPVLRQNPKIVVLLNKLALNHKDVSIHRTSFNHAAIAFNEGISYFPFSIFSEIYNIYFVETLKVEVVSSL